ncbi:MAG: hypothetical protein DI535_30135 [Citrobacter freundii]|nr:MAG: hypothetical protein DI535_30135 [Citrobacter freundii]
MINYPHNDPAVQSGVFRFFHKKEFDLAVKDLERAYELQPDHKNAGTYLRATLLDWAKECVVYSFAIVCCHQLSYEVLIIP